MRVLLRYSAVISSLCLGNFAYGAGGSNFKPWDYNTHSSHYNIVNGQPYLKKAFVIDTNTTLASIPTGDDGLERTENGDWYPLFDTSYDQRSSPIFVIEKAGIIFNGNNVRVVAEGIGNVYASSSLAGRSVSNLGGLGRPFWTTRTSGRFLQVKPTAFKSGTAATDIYNLNVWCFDNGVDLDGNRTRTEHPVTVRNSLFQRNFTHVYVNSNNATIRNNTLLESFNSGIYLGSTSHKNFVRNNLFRRNHLDQNGSQTYNESIGHLVLDTSWGNRITSNTFEKNDIAGVVQNTGIAIYRNKGEIDSSGDPNLREDVPHDNEITNNVFQDQDVAIHIGSRQGRGSHDITGERRDYAFDTYVGQNQFDDCVIGIKVNTDGNTIEDNTFSNTYRPIVLHCVFFNLKDITIRNQASVDVQLFLDNAGIASDPNYGSQFNRWFADNTSSNGLVQRSEKVIEVTTARGGVAGFLPRSAVTRNEVREDYVRPSLLWHSYAGSPRQTVQGEMFSRTDVNELEFVSIYNNPITRIDRDYYSIVIHDQRGNEINRCGKSTTKWKQIAVGNFTKYGEDMQVAAVPLNAINGKYPVFIFDRGFEQPTAVYFAGNRNSRISITTLANYDGLRVKRGRRINTIKP